MQQGSPEAIPDGMRIARILNGITDPDQRTAAELYIRILPRDARRIAAANLLATAFVEAKFNLALTAIRDSADPWTFRVFSVYQRLGVTPKPGGWE